MSKQQSGPGRPRIIDSPEEFDALVEDYRKTCQENGEPLTFTGMALHLGFSDRRSFYDYAEYEGFSRSVSRAKMLVEAEYERTVAENGMRGCGGAIFALKNHGWEDRSQMEHTGADGQPLFKAYQGVDPDRV